MLRFKEVNLMLDCGLITQTVLNFLPLPLVPSARLNNLPSWVPRNCPDPRLEGVSIQNFAFISNIERNCKSYLILGTERMLFACVCKFSSRILPSFAKALRLFRD